MGETSFNKRLAALDFSAANEKKKADTNDKSNAKKTLKRLATVCVISSIKQF
jgi:hypothetical protein